MAAQDPAPMVAEQAPLPTIAEKTLGMEERAGLFTFYWEENAGHLWWKIADLDRDVLYATSLATGLGSNPVGLDRGQLGSEQIVGFERSGPKLLLVARNLRYRALSDSAAERRAVAESFAPSVLWGFEIAAAEDGAVLVNATEFLLRDARGVARTLERSDQGSFSLDASRSAIYLPRTKAFPNNVEIEATLTFVSDEPGPLVAQTAAVAQSVTLRLHHSLVRLPPDGYTPRRYDPRVGYGTVRFADYAAPIDAPLEVHWIRRHRLQKRDPGAARSVPVEPIVYYLDPGVPEPVRAALREGASWWAAAFEAAGFVDAFRVEDLPAGADPLDVRYNMIHWVHRSTRGWSYGGSIADPRTGEILKGNVLLGSLRVRQDHMILDAFAGGENGACAAAAHPGVDHLLPADDPRAVDLALARLRQLSAHEVGHTLGLTHNFAASTYDGRASVMDYPAPLVRLGADGALDLTDAYAVGIGSYDAFAIRYGYQQFAPGVAEAPELARLVDAESERYLFITDADARALGSAHPQASLWDNGNDPVAALVDALRIRALGLERFGAAQVGGDEPLAMLQVRLVPLYLHHRFQAVAAAKSVGGVTFHYAVGAAAAGAASPVAPGRQRAALEALLGCLAPEQLALPATLAGVLVPPPPGYGGERFAGFTGRTFDAHAMAAAAADLIVGALLQRQRAARLTAQAAADPTQLSLRDVVAPLLAGTWQSPQPAGRRAAALHRVVQRVVVDQLMDLAATGAAAPAVRATALWGLREVQAMARAQNPALPDQAAHRAAVHRDIRAFLDRPADAVPRTRAPTAPPGEPIGSPSGG
ncbi:MAG: zinc-dependent metalloprotease [Planctomycetota bacterium]